MNNKDLTSLSAIALSNMIHQRQVSCKEVMLSYLEQIHKFNPRVNAIVSLLPDEQLIDLAKEKMISFIKLRT